MRNLRKTLWAWLLVFSLLLGMMPVGFAAGDEEISLTNGDFESGTTGWALVGYSEVKTDSGSGATNTTNALNLWISDSETAAGSAAYTASGSYYFTFDISGKDADSGLRYAVTCGEKTLAQSGSAYTGKDWNQWENLETETFTLSETANVTFTLSGTQPAGWWGYLDNLRLYKTDGSDDSPSADTYAVTVSASSTSGVKAGDTLTFTAEVTKGGQPITELGDLNLWFYPDSWKDGHTGGVSDGDSYEVAVNTGKVLSTDITLRQAGTYYMAAQLKKDDVELAIGFVTITVAAAEKPGPVETPDPVSAGIYVPYVAGSGGDFIRGVDVSSLLSILNSGAHYYAADGRMLGSAGDIDAQGQAFMQLLANSGVNWVRLRVWPDPYDSNRNGYGGGNNDLEAAKRMGKWAADAGLKTLIDFHYSDFWCDPSKQKSPKAWADLGLDARVEAVRKYTADSLNALIAAGVDVRMVQVGNETNNGICGVMYGTDGWESAAKIFAAGCDAVHSVTNPNLGQDETILAAVHFANPEKPGTFAGYAKELNDNGVDYDVFASSYYPYWHGSIDNLQTVLSNIATTYGKKVMVAETSWAWSLDDGDGHDNTVRIGSNDENPAYVFSVQGQAIEIASVMQGIADIDVALPDGTPAGIGVFYWEPAWIPVRDVSGLTGDARENAVAENRKLWDRYGSGWAASYSVEYDPEDAGLWYGGSAVDNQAVFDFGGKALESLNVFKYVTTGTKDYEVEVVPETLSQEYAQNDMLSLPDSVAVTPTVGEKVTLSGIQWDPDSVAAVRMDQPGTYTVAGTVTGVVAGEQRTISVSCTVTVRKENFLTPNPGFEEGDTAYTLTGVPGKGITQYETGNARSGTWCLHYYQAAAFENARVEHDAVTLEPGSYEFGLYTQGMDSSGRVYVRDAAGNEIGTNDAAAIYATKGWRFWQKPVTRFTLTERTAVIPGLIINGKAEAWGAADDWYIEEAGGCLHGNAVHTARVEATASAAGNIEYWYCPDCGKYFSDAGLTNEITEEETVIPPLSDAAAVTGVTLSPNELRLNRDGTARLTATVTPENAANKRLIWSVGDPGVAEVSSDGMVTALAPGRTVITVRTEDGGFEDSCEVTVLRELSVTAESAGGDDRLAAEFGDRDTIRVSGLVKLADGDSVSVTLRFLLPDGGETGKALTLRHADGALSVSPEELSVDGTVYALDISGIVCLDPNVSIESEETEASVSDALTDLDADARSEVTAAAESVTGNLDSLIAGAADELAKAGEEAAREAGEGVKVLVYMKVEATGYTSPDAASAGGTLPSLRLDITPCYKIVNPGDGTEVTGETEMETKAFRTPVEIQVTLPDGFVKSASDRVAAKHYGDVIEWLDVTLRASGGKFIAAFFADSFSEYELTVSPTVTAVYHALDGEHTAVYHYARIGRTEIPAAKQQADRFLGWSTDPDASGAVYAAGILTQKIIDQMYANLDDSGEIHLYPIFREAGGSPVIPDNTQQGTDSASSARRRPVAETKNTTEKPAVRKESSRNGTFSISPSDPQKGDRVTITAAPDAGYLVDTVKVTDDSGRAVEVTDLGGSTYSFIMPSADVTIAVAFRADAAATAARFADVSASDWFQTAVSYVSANGIMLGNGGRFSPDALLTRGMMAQILRGMAGSSDSGSRSFPDVSANDWFAPAVGWAASQGYMDGYGNGSFGPNDAITREQAAAILYRYAGSPAVSGSLAGFTDAGNVSGFAETALCWATEQGIISGKPGGLLDPKGFATRAEIASILMQFCTNIA